MVHQRTSQSVLPLIALRILLAILGGSSAPRAQAAETRPWRLDELPAAVFADQDQTWRVRFASGLPRESELAWSLAVNNRTLARGESPWQELEGGEFAATITWRTPPIKDGVVVAAHCSLSVTVANRALAETELDMWIFPSDPFASRQEWLKSLQLVVLTLDAPTRRLLAEARLPCRTIGGGAELGRLRTELLMVSGTGPAGKNRSLPRRIHDFVHRGGRCIWLAPPPGSLVLAPDEPGPQSDHLAWQRVSLRRRDVILDYDKRLEERTWPPGSTDYSTFRIVSQKNESGVPSAVWEAATGHEGWPWLEAVSTSGGRLVVCGFPLFEHWARGPTPRYLLASILQVLDETTASATNP